MDFLKNVNKPKKTTMQNFIYLTRKDSKLCHCAGSQSKQQIVHFGFINQPHSGS